MKNEYKHPLDVINERLMNGYYRNTPPFSYDRDVAYVKYMLGYCSKVDYEIAKAKCEMYNYKTTLCKYIMNEDNTLITQLTDISEDKCGKGEWSGLMSIPWTDEGWEKTFLKKPHYSDDENIQKKFEFAVKYSGIGRVLSALCKEFNDESLKQFIEKYFEDNKLWTDYYEHDS